MASTLSQSSQYHLSLINLISRLPVVLMVEDHVSSAELTLCGSYFVRQDDTEFHYAEYLGACCIHRAFELVVVIAETMTVCG